MGPLYPAAAPLAPPVSRVSIAAIICIWGFPSSCTAAAVTAPLAPPAHFMGPLCAAAAPLAPPVAR
eukprot:1768968-Karenia_brevis.AAC.1